MLYKYRITRCAILSRWYFDSYPLFFKKDTSEEMSLSDTLKAKTACPLNISSGKDECYQ